MDAITFTVAERPIHLRVEQTSSSRVTFSWSAQPRPDVGFRVSVVNFTNMIMVRRTSHSFQLPAGPHTFQVVSLSSQKLPSTAAVTTFLVGEGSIGDH